MDVRALAVAATVAFRLVVALGDYFLKLASREEDYFHIPWLYVDFALDAATAFGWVLVMKHPEPGDDRRTILRLRDRAAHHLRFHVPTGDHSGPVKKEHVNP